MTILYTNGCSYTANNDVEREFRYPYLIGKHFDWQVEDKSVPGFCNSIIIRRAMRDCIRLLATGEPIVAMVQLTHQNRFEFAGTPNVDNAWKYNLSHDNLKIDPKVNDYFESVRAEDFNTWPTNIKDYAKQTVLAQKAEAVNSNFLHWTVGLASFFKTNNIRYLIYAGPSFALERLSSDPFYHYLLTDSNVLNLETFDILSTAGTPGRHPDQAGMQRIADYFITRLAEPV
jgi:hypothetical protein